LVEEGSARWVSAVGRVVGTGDARRFVAGGVEAVLELHCVADPAVPVGPIAARGIGLPSPARIIVPCGGLRPVPGFGAARLASARSATEMTAARTEEETPAVDAEPAVPAAAMLGLAGVLMAAAAVARWRWPDGPPDADSDPAEGADGPDGAAVASPDEPEPRGLRLVRVPHERGSG